MSFFPNALSDFPSLIGQRHALSRAVRPMGKTPLYQALYSGLNGLLRVSSGRPDLRISHCHVGGVPEGIDDLLRLFVQHDVILDDKAITPLAPHAQGFHVGLSANPQNRMPAANE